MMMSRQSRINRASIRSLMKQYQAKKFMIINHKTQLALRPEVRKKYKQSDYIYIMGTMPNQQDINQLWMVSSNHKAANRYQLLNQKTNCHIDTDKQEVKLQKPSQKITHKFQPEEELRKDKVLFRLKDSNGYYLTLDGILTLALKDKQNQDFQLFQFVPTGGSNKITMAAYVIYDIQYKFITLMQYNRVGLMKKSSQTNQKWAFEPPLDLRNLNQVYAIKNYHNKMYLAPDQQGNLMVTQKSMKNDIWKFQKKEKDYQFAIYCVPHERYLQKKDENTLYLKKSSSTGWFPMAKI